MIELLIVHNEPAAIRLFFRELQGDYQHAETRDVEEAIDMIARQDIGVILLKPNVDEGRGYQLLEYLIEQDKDIPVVIYGSPNVNRINQIGYPVSYQLDNKSAAEEVDRILQR